MKLKSSSFINVILIIQFVIFSSHVNAYTNCEKDLPSVSLTKDDALARLLQCNRDIVDAKRAFIANETGLITAGETQNPILTLGIGELNPKLGIGPGSVFDKTIDSSIRYEQLIERGGKRDLRIKSSQSLIAGSQQDILEAQRLQSTQLFKAMVDLAAAHQKIDLLSEVVSLYQDTLQANNIRTKKGDLPRLDAERQIIDFNHAQIDFQQALADKKIAQLALANLLAWEKQAELIQVDDAILNVISLQNDEFNTDARSDVKAAKRRVEATTSLRELAQAQQKVDITASVQYDHWPTSPSNTTGTGDTIGFTVSVPLQINHRYEGEIARANSDFEAANEVLERVQANAKADWFRFNADVTSADNKLKILQNDQMPRAENVAKTVELGYKKGALSLIDLLDARRMLRQTRLDLLEARANLARSVLILNQAIVANKI